MFTSKSSIGMRDRSSTYILSCDLLALVWKDEEWEKRQCECVCERMCVCEREERESTGKSQAKNSLCRCCNEMLMLHTQQPHRRLNSTTTAVHAAVSHLQLKNEQQQVVVVVVIVVVVGDGGGGRV